MHGIQIIIPVVNLPQGAWLTLCFAVLVVYKLLGCSVCCVLLSVSVSVSVSYQVLSPAILILCPRSQLLQVVVCCCRLLLVAVWCVIYLYDR